MYMHCSREIQHCIHAKPGRVASICSYTSIFFYNQTPIDSNSASLESNSVSSQGQFSVTNYGIKGDIPALHITKG
jgi:hypothetical protein